MISKLKEKLENDKEKFEEQKETFQSEVCVFHSCLNITMLCGG